MLARLLRDSLVYSAAAVLARLTTIVLLPLYARVLEPSDIGTIDVLVLVTSLVNLTIALEIGQGLARYFPDAKDENERRSLASTAIWFTVGCYSAFAVIGLATAPIVGPALLGEGADLTVVRLAVVATWLGGIVLILQNQVRYELRSKAYAAVSVVFATVSGVTIALLILTGVGVAGVFAGQIAGSIVAVSLAAVLVRRRIVLRISVEKLRTLLSFSTPLVPASIAVFVLLSIDRLAVNSFLGLGEVGTFGVAYRVALVVNIAMLGFQLAITPLIYHHYGEEETRDDLARAFRYFVAVAGLTWCALSLFASEIVTIVATDRYAAAVPVIPILVPAVVAANLYVFAPGLALAKRTRVTAAITFAGAVLNTLLNVALIPLLGIVGAATATLVSASAVFAGYMLFSQRIYPVDHRWGALSLAVVACAGVIVAGQVTTDGGVGSVVQRLLLIGLAAAAMVALKVIPAQELRSTFMAKAPQ